MVSNFSGGVLQILWGGSPNLGGCLQFFGGVLQIFGGGGLHRNTVNVRPVRILLECILVLSVNLLAALQQPN